MFELALHHLTDGERERDASTSLRRRQQLKTSAQVETNPATPAPKPTNARLSVSARPAQR